MNQGFEAVEADKSTGLEIAVIGMAGRFPAARTLDEFWKNLINGVESIYFLSDEEIQKEARSSKLLENPNYVKVEGGILEDKEFFDASFFGYTPKEAELMDPQLRLFHQCAWEVLESAGYDPYTYGGLIGTYVSASPNYYWKSLAVLSGKAGELGDFASRFLTESDFISTKVAHKLNLRGPASNISTACSSSLVSIHMACRSLLIGECDMALAGGISVWGMKSRGYLYQEGMINSPDGHCRAFDTNARGTVGGEGLGVVMLKPLEEALEDRDYIYAVIKSSAINNDGTRKVGYTAPSIDGQAEVIRTAHRIGNVDPESITYIETHGTGTELGDPVEVAALKLAFNSDKKGFCAIGSIKTNIGHLDYAAGVAGFIKTVLALKHRIIPPSLHYQEPNPRSALGNSPFYVNIRVSQWKSENHPLRAGVSSFGIGGTNVHVVLEEFSGGTGRLAPLPVEQHSRGYQLILLSAKTPSALDKMTENLAEYLKKNLLNRGNHESPTNPGPTLADVAYTLQTGRSAFQYRRFSCCGDLDEAVENLFHPGSRKVFTAQAKEEKQQVIFMFPGLGSQYVNMGLELYQKEPLFRREMDRCFEILKPKLDYDIEDILYPHPDYRGGSPCPPKDCTGSPKQGDHKGSPGQPDRINHFEIAQPVIFILEYALAKLLIGWGIEPYAMIGYSFGEYTAACISGVFSLEDTLEMILSRGKLIEQTPAGSMLSVPLTVEEVRPFLSDGLVTAIDNGPSCVISGPVDAIDEFNKQMKKNRYVCVPLNNSRAIHSPLMQPILNQFAAGMNHLTGNSPQIPYISNVTGKWLTREEAADPGYWSKHLEGTVRFARGVKELLKLPNPVFVEVGPGYQLSVLVRHHISHFPTESRPLTVNLIKHPQDKIPDRQYLLTRIGRLWLSGLKIQWTALYGEEKRNRLPLPTYPFEEKAFWLEGDPFDIKEKSSSRQVQLEKNPCISDWFYVPSWKRSVLPKPLAPPPSPGLCWLVFTDDCGLGSRLGEQLTQEDQIVITVEPGTRFGKVNECRYSLHPGQSRDYEALFKELVEIGKIPDRIIHLWELGSGDQFRQRPSCQPLLDTGFYSLVYLAQALGKHRVKHPVNIAVISDMMQDVNGDKPLHPEKAALLGAVRVIPLEYSNIRCASIDIEPAHLSDPGAGTFIHQLLWEFDKELPDAVAAYRGGHRWVQIFESLPLEKNGPRSRRLREKGVYLITGGLGGIGLELAGYLARSVEARLVLTGRSFFPVRERWQEWLDSHDELDPVNTKIRKVIALEEMGAEVLVCQADVTVPGEMQRVIANAEQRFGVINGVIHAAGLPDGGVIPLRTREMTDSILAPKVTGTLVLDQVLENMPLDFFMLCSSVTSLVALFGQVGYCAANNFLDAFAHQKTLNSDIFTVSINWDAWKETGMGIEAVKQLEAEENIKDGDLLLKNGMTNAEAIDVFNRILDYSLPQVVVSTSDLGQRLKRQVFMETSEISQTKEIEKFSGTLYQRPELSTEYTAPGTKFEKDFAGILKNFFGYDQVGINDNFFEFGVTSLTIIRIKTLLQEVLSIDIPIVLLFEYPTIYSLGQYMEQEENGESLSISETRENEEMGKNRELLHGTIGLLRQDG